MDREQVFEKVLNVYHSSFDITKPYELDEVSYDAYGYCNITNAKYVLVKKAELWRALCFEHAFFKSVSKLEEDDVALFYQQMLKKVEPDFVRKNEKYPEKNHMYSYITGIFICDELTKEAEKKIKKIHYYKNYLFSFRGYCEIRLIAVDLKNNRVIGNGAARDMIKDYKRFI